MPNGMANVDVTYKIVEGIPDDSLLTNIINLYVEIFEDADVSFFKDRINEKSDLITVLAFSNTHLVGFKIGYRYSYTTFYSWVGGVKHQFRNLGIATALANRQEIIVKSYKYTKLRTKSMNQFKAMMSLNLKNGFDIVNVYTNTKEQTKIVFEKEI